MSEFTYEAADRAMNALRAAGYDAIVTAGRFGALEIPVRGESEFADVAQIIRENVEEVAYIEFERDAFGGPVDRAYAGRIC